MKRYIIILLCVVAAKNVAAREVVSLNRNWKFFSNSEQSSDGALTVNLPHIWNNDALGGKKDYFRGIGNYLKRIDIPAGWSSKKVYIRFEGANSITNLYVNGRHVGEHRGGYTAFAYDITPYLQFGTINSLWVLVNNSQTLDVMPTAGDANSYGGLFRNASLVVTEPVSIAVADCASDGVYVSTTHVTREKVEGNIAVRIESPVEKSVQVRVAVFAPGGDTVFLREGGRVKVPAKGSATASIPFAIERAELWDGVKNPFLYNVSVKLLADNAICDSLVVATGFRAIAVDPKAGFILNGEPYPLHGVVLHQDRAMVGTALLPYQVREDFDFVTEIGANAVRVAGGAHSRQFYDLCDRHGILVWSDIPFMGAAYFTDKAFVNSPLFRANGMLQLTETIRQQFNHPSVAMWGLFSEISTVGDNPATYVRELNTLAKKEDPSRMTVAASNHDGDINFITDLIVWNQSYGWNEGMPADLRIWMDQLRREWSSLRSGISYAAGASIYHQNDSLSRPQPGGNWHPERWQTFFHEEYFRLLKNTPDFWGTFVGNLFDYGAAGRAWGQGNGINDKGLVTFDRKYRKDAFYFYKANWNTADAFVYLAERRWDSRRKRRQDIKVYSNLPQVELFVAGASLGVKEGVDGMFVWKGVELRPGDNTVEARAGSLSDVIGITIGE